MDWYFQNDRPIYSQLIEQITLAIISGRLPPGERLPSVRDLAADAGVNPNTMQKALGELEREGLLYTQRTSGRFITEDTALIETAKNKLAAGKVETFLADMEKTGFSKEQILTLVKQAIESWREEV